MNKLQKRLVPELRFSEFSEFFELTKLKDITKINQGLQIPISKRYTEKVKDSYFYITNEFLRDKSKRAYFIVNPPESVICIESDILMTRTGNTGQVVTNVIGAFHNNFFKIKYDKEKVDKIYLVIYLKLYKTQCMILRYAGTSTIPDLNHSDFYRLEIFLPKIKEQQKIGNFLTAVDQRISLLKQKKAALETYKKGLMQKFFSQEIRFKDENSKDYPDWVEKRLGDVFARSTLKNRENNISNVFTNSAIYGIVNQMEFFDHSVANKNNLEGYYIVEKDNFIYNPRISKFAPVGPLKRNKLDSGVMSPLYTVLKNKIGNKTYLEYYFDTTHWHRYMCGIANYGARHDRMNIQNNDFMKMPIPYPSLEEQQKIADCLSSMDQSINKLKNQIEQTTQFKKGLLQKMFV